MSSAAWPVFLKGTPAHEPMACAQTAYGTEARYIHKHTHTHTHTDTRTQTHIARHPANPLTSDFMHP